MNVYRESIQEFRAGAWTVRVWRELEPHTIWGMHDMDVSQAIVEAKNANAEFDQAAERILALPRVNACEVRDKAGNGVVFYRTEQVHEAGGRLIQVI